MARVQQSFVRLQKLLQVEPFKIVSLWSNGETRLNDFSGEVAQWRNSANKALKKLANPKVFKTAYVHEGTLAFAGSTVNVPGISGEQPVDFDRRVLYNDSQLIGKAITYTDAIQHQASRSKRRKRPDSFTIQPQSSVFKVDAETIKRMYQKLGTPVTPLIIIGDELIELE